MDSTALERNNSLPDLGKRSWSHEEGACPELICTGAVTDHFQELNCSAVVRMFVVKVVMNDSRWEENWFSVERSMTEVSVKERDRNLLDREQCPWIHFGFLISFSIGSLLLIYLFRIRLSFLIIHPQHYHLCQKCSLTKSASTKGIIFSSSGTSWVGSRSSLEGYERL
ncbi:hypothetical protein Tco_0453291 [Tanacetum coccineum]